MHDIDNLILDYIWKYKNRKFRSKETYGQVRRSRNEITNLKMKHVGQLAIIGVLLKAVNTSLVRTMQGRTYLIKRRLYRWFLLQTY